MKTRNRDDKNAHNRLQKEIKNSISNIKVKNWKNLCCSINPFADKNAFQKLQKFSIQIKIN